MSTLPVFEYASARSKDEALASIRNNTDWNQAAIYAGGVDLLDLMKERLYTPKRLVNIKPAAESLHFIKREADGTTRIGPLVTLAEIAANADLARDYPALTRACGSAATPQIRNLATIGGNLCQRPRCWYYRSEDFPCLRKGGTECYARDGENRYHAVFTKDEPCVMVHPSTGALPLLALNASVTVTRTHEQVVIPLEKFFVRPKDDIHRENVLKPGDLITEITIPAASRGFKSAYVKQREKQSYDWALTDVAIAAKIDGDKVQSARIVLGAVSPVPQRALAAEEFLAGKPLTPENAARAGELAIKGAEPLGQNAYKLKLIPVIVRRTLLALNGSAPKEA